MPKRPDDLIYTVDEIPPPPKLILLGLQHAVLISVYFVMIVIVVRASGASHEASQSALSLGMIAAAIATILQGLWKGPVGSGYLAPPVFSAIYLGPSLLAAKVGGMPTVCGMTIFAGLIEIILSRLFERLRPAFPPAICGLIVAIVGIQLGLVGIEQVTGIAYYDHPHFHMHLFVSILTLVIIVSLSVWFRGMMRLMCSMVGLAAGFALALCAGLISAESLGTLVKAPLFALPSLDFIAYKFDPSVLPVFFIAGLAAALRTIGVITTCQKINDADWKRPSLPSIKGGMLADGIGCLVGGLLGVPGMNAAPSLVGVSKASGATSRYIAFAAGAILVAMSFFPKIASVFLILPLSVVGAALVFTGSFMISGGIQIMVSRNIDSRMTYVIGISMLLGLSREIYPTFYEHLPVFFQSFTGTVLSLGVIPALFLNLLFRLGLKQTKVIVLEEEDIERGGLKASLREMVNPWKIADDLVERCVESAAQIVTHLREARLMVGHSLKIVTSYDQVNLILTINYEGELLSLPNVGIKKKEFLEEESFAYGLADFLTGVYPDRMESSAKDKKVTIQLFFTV